MPKNPYVAFAFALDGLIRSIVKGHGGEAYERKCMRDIAETLERIADDIVQRLHG
jgi:hypothetical protein